MSGPDIFISYNREDAAIARLYADAFTAAGLKVWWDATLRSGEDYDAVTEHSLRTAKAVVVLWSPRSVISRWVRAEATIADRGQTLMPVMIEPCDRPVMFELKQTAEMSHWRGDVTDKAWLALVSDVKRKAGIAEVEPPAPAPATAAPETAAAAPGNLGRAAVAILPFGWRGSDADFESLAEDLTDDLTRELSSNGFFKVVAARTMAAGRGKAIDHKELSQKLQARYLVEGRLQRSGADNRLTAQLIDGGSGNVLWSMRMNAATGDDDFSSDRLSVAVAAQFSEQIIQREQALAMARTAPLSAWDHILRAAALAQRADEPRALQAVEEARLAVEAAPDVGLAHAMLASAMAAVPESKGLRPDEDQIRDIQAQTRQAMRLDGNNPTVLMELAGAYQGLGEYEICLRLAKRTVDLAPSSPASHRILGDSYRMLGRTAEAVEAYRKQDRLSPFDSGRNVALSNLGMCLLLEGQAEAAEDALDRALMLDPEYPVALEWKAITAETLGKHQVALETMRQIRSSEAAVPLDRHVWEIERNALLRERTEPHITTLRRLWRAAGAESADSAEIAEMPVARKSAAANSGAGHDQVTVLDVPVAKAAVPLGESVPVETARSDIQNVPDRDPAAQPVMFAQGELEAPGEADYLTAAAVPKPGKLGKPAKAASRPDNDDSVATPARHSNVPKFAMLGGALLLVGGGAAAWMGGLVGSPETKGPSFTLAAAPAAISGVAAPLSEGSAAAPGVPALGGAIDALLAVSRSAGRSAGELAALEAGQRSMAPLLVQLQVAPDNQAVADQLKTLALGLVQQQGPALSADADRVLRSQQQAAAAGRGLSGDAAAKVERALGRARSARGEIATALATAQQAGDAVTALVAQRGAVAAYVRLQSVPVAAAVASAKASAVNVASAAASASAAAAADSAKMQNRLSLARVDIDTARTEVARLSSQIAGLTQLEKPGLFASGTKRQSMKLRKDNADRARALASEADQIAAQAKAMQDANALSASLARVRGLRSQASTLLASSTAALKSAASAPDPKATETPKK
ncbi:TIR domain-containing protein [Novosphingobium aquiterrae]|uniref:TIR domain-containing protein n=1 Tax=Novosphingobium aquiterrae TaxID=624388 RepID=A0ABV6PEF9_9SPHN